MMSRRMNSGVKKRLFEAPLVPNKTEPKRKKDKIVETKVKNEDNKSRLKTTISKVRKSGIKDGPCTYKVKGVVNVSTHSECPASTIKIVTDETKIGPEIPSFTDKDIDDLIKCGDLETLFGSAVDSFTSADLNPDSPIFSTLDVADKSENSSFIGFGTLDVADGSENSSFKDLDGPIDLTIDKNKFQSSMPMPSIPTRIDACINQTSHQREVPAAHSQHDIPLAHSSFSTGNKAKPWMVDMECSPVYSDFRTENKRKSWMVDKACSSSPYSAFGTGRNQRSWIFNGRAGSSSFSACSTGNKRKLWMVDKEKDGYSSFHSDHSTGKKRKIWMTESECSSTTETPIRGIQRNVNATLTKDIHQDSQNHFKSPVTTLEEILGLQDIQPRYHIEPFSESIRFHCTVWFGNHEAQGTGTGASTADAKNTAASSLLEMLISNRYFGNAVGNLQEFCVSRKWRHPVYSDEMKGVTLQSSCYYTISCSVNGHKEFGHGKNKKAAKLFAAYKMWMKLTTQ